MFSQSNHKISYWFNRTRELTREYQYGGVVASLFMTSWAIQSFYIDQCSHSRCSHRSYVHSLPGLVCSNQPEGCVLPCIYPSSSQEVPEVCFRGRSIPVSGSSLRPRFITPHLYKMRGCSSGSSETPGHSRIEFSTIGWFSSVRADGSSASRCRSVSQRLGLRLNVKKSVLLPAQRTTFLGVLWDSIICKHVCLLHIFLRFSQP